VADGKTYTLSGVMGFLAPYSAQLQGYIGANGDAVTCTPQGFPGEFICAMADGTDLAKVALVNGAARVAPDAPDSYRVQQLDALNNKRGFWAMASPEIVAAAMAPPPVNPEYTFVPGDDGADGIAYVGGAPMVVMEGEPAPVFLVYGDDTLGWGYYDHFHHWRRAPDRYWRHMEHFHPGGHGLRGYENHHFGHEVGGAHVMAHEAALRGVPPHPLAAVHPGAMSGAVGHPGMAGGMPNAAGHPGMAGSMPNAAGHPGMTGGMPNAAGHPGMAGGMPNAAGHPGMAGGMPNAAGHPGMPAAGMGAQAGFVHPGAAASAGGFHPSAPAAAPAMHVAAAPAPAPHPSGGGGGGGGKKK
jgi:hypothetical protein